MSSARPISEFLKLKREHDTCTLLAKGPSLDKYNPEYHAEGYVLGLNEVPLVLPCHAGIYLDVALKDLQYPDHVTLFRHASNRGEQNGRGFYFTPWNIEQMMGEPSEVRRFGSGSAAYALAIMGMWGIRRLALWGCDCLEHPRAGNGNGAGSVYADCMRAASRFQGSYHDYGRVADGMRHAIEHFSFETEYHHV